MAAKGNGGSGRRSEKLLGVRLADSNTAGGQLHPGWVRATAILLIGLKRLEEVDESNGSQKFDE